MPNTPTKTAYGGWILVASSAAGLALSVFNYFEDIGIGGTAGALLVIVSTALLLAASLFTLFVPAARWLLVTLDVLILLGILGTALAAYFLEAGLLLFFMALALVGWFAALAASPSAGTESARNGAHVDPSHAGSAR